MTLSVAGYSSPRIEHESGSILERLRQHARAREHEPALVFPLEQGDGEHQALTWGELEELVLRFGQYLVAHGAADGDVVLLLTRSVRKQIVGFLGAMAAGCVPNILSYPSMKQSASAFAAMLGPVLDTAQPRLVVVSRPFVETVSGCCRPERLLVFPEEAELPAAGAIRPARRRRGP